MKLTLQTPTANLNQSVDFYKKLGFQVKRNSLGALAVDSQICIQINSQRTARVSILLHQKDWTETILKLKNNAPSLEVNEGFMTSDPNGILIELRPENSNSKMLSSNNKCLLGNYGGVCIETLDLQRSYEFWETLGFKSTIKDFSKSWIEMKSNSGDSISLLKSQQCPHLFFNPSLAYFNGCQNLEIIEEIKSQKISIAEEITEFNTNGTVDNIILKDSGGLGFFIFND